MARDLWNFARNLGRINAWALVMAPPQLVTIIRRFRVKSAIHRQNRNNDPTPERLPKSPIIHLSKWASPKIHVLKRVLVCENNCMATDGNYEVLSRSGLSEMSVRKCYVECLSVKSKSVFPDLLSIETKFVPRQQRVQLASFQSGAFCKEVMMSLPLFEVWVVVAMFLLANS